MDIELVNGENFLALKSFKLDLSQRGLLLIQGSNEDDPSAKSNGAGKSSLVDAPFWCLFGVTARGISGDAVVNETEGKNCFVQMQLREAGSGTVVEVKRYRKHKTEKNSLQLRVNGVAVTKGTDAETQQELERLIGCSKDVFAAAIYAGQEAMPDLPGMTDKQLKVLIEEAAGVEVLNQAYLLALAKLNEAEKEKVEAGAKYANALAVRTTEEARLHVAVEAVEDFQADRFDKRKAVLAAMVPEVAALRATKEELSKLRSEVDIQAEINKNKAELESHSEKQKQYGELLAALKVAQSAEMAARNKVPMVSGMISKIEADLLNIDKVIGSPCGTCGKVYEKHDLAHATAHKQSELDEAKKLHASAIVAAGVALDERVNAQAKTEAFARAMPDTSTIIAAIESANNELSKRKSLESVIRHKVELIRKAKDDGDRKLTERNPHEKALLFARVALKNADVTMRMREAEHFAASREFEIAGHVAKIFSPSGVRAHILDTVTPFLNDRTKEYLGALTDGNIHATWTTLTPTAKGELREKFSIDVVNTKGAKTFAGLSGGEKRKVRLACALALQDLVASRASKPFNLFIADEVDHALDESGLERLMGVLEKRARERGTVLVISHNSLSDWIDEVITVTKKSGQSTVTGATEKAVAPPITW